MSIDITNETETQILRDKWTARGVPTSLFDEMIAEANKEYNSTIGYEDYSSFAMLTINLVDNGTLSNVKYLYTILNNNLVLQGKESLLLTELFGGVACVNLAVHVVKLDATSNAVLGEGYATLLHSKDEAITITLTNITNGETTMESKFLVLKTDDSQAIPNGTQAIITLGEKVFDVLNEFNTANNEFSPQASGYYVLTAMANFNLFGATLNSGHFINLTIDNGSGDSIAVDTKRNLLASATTAHIALITYLTTGYHYTLRCTTGAVIGGTIVPSYQTFFSAHRLS